MGVRHLKAVVLDWRENGSNCHVSGIRQHVNSCDVIYVSDLDFGEYICINYFKIKIMGARYGTQTLLCCLPRRSPS